MSAHCNDVSMLCAVAFHQQTKGHVALDKVTAASKQGDRWKEHQEEVVS